MRAPWCTFALVWLGCGDDKVGPDPAVDSDGDGDGFPAEVDCDDGDATLSPGALESCDGRDNDCDGLADEADATDAPAWYLDADGDGYGQNSIHIFACAQPSGFVLSTNDCDDLDSASHPGAEEVCDEADNDCDGEIDEDSDGALEGAQTWYEDGDGDGYGDPASAIEACTAPEGYVAIALDCDDGDASANPEATWYYDGDGDGYGDPEVTATACELPAGHVDNADDCDDSDATVYPDTEWYQDLDSDGYGDPDDVLVSCEQPAGRVGNDGDCDDTEARVSPGKAEICDDDIDQDCSGRADNACPTELSFDAADLTIDGVEAYDYAGRAVAALDVDGDGQDDLLVGAYGADDGGSNGGAVAFWLGPLSAGATDLSTADWRLAGASAGDYFGRTLSPAGDVDGDGEQDLIVGAYGVDDGAKSGGAAYVFLGPLTGAAAPDITILGTEEADRLSAYLPGMAGDIDGDGQDDLLLDASGRDSGADDGAGAVFLILGPLTADPTLSAAEATIQGTSASASIGRAAASVGDMDGDGLGELVLGAPYEDGNIGAAFVFSGPITGTLDTGDALWVLSGSVAFGYAGSAVGSAGDNDGDGYNDLWVGSYGAGSSAEGAAYLLAGPLSAGGALVDLATATFTGDNPDDQVGYAGHHLDHGDLDADGLDDQVIGVGYSDAGAEDGGALYVVWGPARGAITASTVDYAVTGSEPKAYAGTSASVGADLDGDAYGDLVVGAHGSDGLTGAVGVYYASSFDMR